MAPNVKGSAVDSRLDFVREIADDAALNRVLDRMSRPHRERIEEGVLASAWVPFELFTELNVAIDAELGEGDLKLVREMGRFSARSNLPTVYRIFLRMGSVHFVLRKASRLWRVHYDSGQLTHEELGDDAGRLTVEGFAAPHRAHCLSVLGWVEGAIELTGSTPVEAREERCRCHGQDECRFYARWE